MGLTCLIQKRQFVDNAMVQTAKTVITLKPVQHSAPHIASAQLVTAHHDHKVVVKTTKQHVCSTGNSRMNNDAALLQ